MSKRWTFKDDIWLVTYQDIVGGDYVAKNDLGFFGKNAGKKRIEKLKSAGLLESLEDFIQREFEIRNSWVEMFGRESEREFFDATREGKNMFPRKWTDLKTNTFNTEHKSEMSDKVEYDDALNDAGWVMIEKLQTYGPLNGHQFNHIKSCLKDAIEAYLHRKHKENEK